MIPPKGPIYLSSKYSILELCLALAPYFYLYLIVRLFWRRYNLYFTLIIIAVLTVIGGIAFEQLHVPR